MDKKSFLIITLIIIFAFTIRFIDFSHPSLTTEEARIANRGYTLVKYGTDELGRKFPLIFNSLDDYQLPAVSYLTMLGEAVFGKTDLGVRIPFILIGILLILLIYKIGRIISNNSNFGLVSAFIVALSPALIFLSKTPNTAIVLTFIFTLLFYLIISKKNLILIILTMILAVLVSKFSWFLLLPFTFYVMWLSKINLRSKRSYILLSFAVLIVVTSFFLFSTIPQSKRSLMENNFSILTDITIQNGVNRLRGQGVQSGWPPLINRLLLNKLNFLAAGLLHWLSHLNPAIYFGQFDKSGLLNFSYLGAWVKILIIPTVLGIFEILRKSDKKGKLFLLFLIFTYPSLLIYPKYSLDLIVLTLPFMSLIITEGIYKLIEFKKKVGVLIFLFVILELVLNLYNFTPEYKNTNVTRPGWIKSIVEDVYKASLNTPTAVSDDIVSDIAPFIWWYTPRNEISNLDIPWPYKFRQYNLSNIKIIVSNGKFRTCGLNEKLVLFVSNRDLNKIQHDIQIEPSNKYKDNLDEEKAYQITQRICLE